MKKEFQMNLALICFLGTDYDLVLRKYTDWFVSGFDIGLKNHYTVYMHEQTILDNPVVQDVDLVHIVFEENSLSRVESTIKRFMYTDTTTTTNMNVFPKSAKFSFTCIQSGRKNTQFTSNELNTRLSMHLGGQFNGCSCWSLCFDWSEKKYGFIKSIQYRKVCDKIENEGLYLGITGRVKQVDVSSNQVETYRGSTLISE
jgi:hypothetical protein